MQELEFGEKILISRFRGYTGFSFRHHNCSALPAELRDAVSFLGDFKTEHTRLWPVVALPAQKVSPNYQS